MKYPRLSLLLLAVAFAGQAQAGAREQFNAFTQGLQSMQANFEQRVFGPNGSPTDRSGGVVRLSAPRQFRWEYQHPYKQLIVADGNHVWSYDPDLEQVTVSRQSFEEQSSPMAVLIDPAELDRQFNVSEGGHGDGLDWLQLEPKKEDDASFVRARLGFSARGLVRLELLDALGQKTVMGFSAWQRNPRFAADAFRFTPPEGVEVVGDVADSAEVIPLGE